MTRTVRDLLFLAIPIAFFALTVLGVRAIERLLGPADERSPK